MDEIFSGWDETTDDFFSDLEEQEQSEPIEAQTQSDEVTQTDEPQANQGDVNAENVEAKGDKDLFEKEENEIENLEETVDDDALVINALQEKGIIDFEFNEEDTLEDVMDELIERQIKSRLEDFPNDAKDLIQFILKGGSVNDFVSRSTPDKQLTDNMDLSTEENQIAVLRQLMAEDDEDQDAIETEIELLKDSGRLEKFARRKYDKWQAQNRSKRENLIREQEAQKEQARNQIKQMKQEYTSMLTSSDNLDGLDVSKNDARTIPAFITDRSVKLNNGVEITQMQQDLYYELPKNPKAMLQLAVLLKSRNADGTFNFDRVANKVKTEVTNNIKTNMRRNRMQTPSENRGNKSLAEYFS